MALTTRTELLAAIANWLNRSDLSTAIADDFVPLAEAEMKRRLRRATESTTIYISAGNMNGPTDMAAPITLRLSSTVPSLDKPLTFCTPEMLGEVLARNAGVEGRPTHYGFWDGQLQFAPVPDQSYDGILLYYQQLTPLSSIVASNAVLAEAPDAYLFGALLQAAPYLEHDERIPVWQGKFDAAIDQLNKVRDEESYSAGLKEVRLPRVFG
jgi:hypothetical protein